MFILSAISMAQSEGKWAKEIAAFKAQDEKNTPPQGAIVFTGSSSVRLWTNLAKAFPGSQIINRGFGGSQYSDVVEHLETLVLKHSPKKVFIYSGDNDINAGKSPEGTLAECRKIQAALEQKLPETRLYFIAAKPSPSRWQLREKMATFNKILNDYCKQSPNATFIDIWTPMIGADGKPNPDLFVKDNLHLNGKGYELWARIVRPYVEEGSNEVKVKNQQ
ncbi:MAG: SGNH/GDSL hydrolase family protein [Verrucomicrobiales bacterium]